MRTTMIIVVDVTVEFELKHQKKSQLKKQDVFSAK